MNQEGVKDIGITSADNSFELNNGAIIIRFKPICKLMISRLFTVVAVVADIYNSIFFFMKECLDYCCNSCSNAFVKRNFA